MLVRRGKRGELSRCALVSFPRFPTLLRSTVLIPELDPYMRSSCPRLARSGRLIVEFLIFRFQASVFWFPKLPLLVGCDYHTVTFKQRRRAMHACESCTGQSLIFKDISVKGAPRANTLLLYLFLLLPQNKWKWFTFKDKGSIFFF